MNEELKIIISAEIDKLKQAMEQSQKALKETEKTGKNTGSSLGKALGAAGKAVGTAMKAMMTAVLAAGAAMVGLTESTREYRTQQAMLATAFQTAGGSAEMAKEIYSDLYRVLGDTGKATEASQQLAMLTTEQEALSEWTQICQGVYATFGDSLPIESLAEAANETAKTGELTGALADALNWAGVNEAEFADALFLCNTEAEREALIRKTLTGLYGEAATTYEKTAADILKANEAQLMLTDATAAAGAALEPLMTTLKVGLANALASVMPSFGMFTEGLNEMVNGVEGGSEKMLEGIKGLVSQISSTILEAIPMIGDFIYQGTAQVLTILGEVIPQILEQIIVILPQIIDNITTNIPILLQAAIDFLMSIVEAIPVIIPALIAALPKIIDSILNAVTTAIPLLLDGALQLLMSIVEAIPLLLPELINALPQIINSIIDFCLNNIPVLIDGAIELFMALVMAIPEIIPQLIGQLGTIVTTVLETLGGRLPEIFKSLWDNFINGGSKALDGIKNIFKSIPEWFSSIFSSAWTAVKNVFSAGGKIFDGIKDGILSGLKAVVNAIIEGINKVIAVPFNGINAALQGIKGIDILGLKPFDWLPTISVPQIPKLYKGGVLEKGQVGLLEGSGAEAVVPLENNDAWLTKIAEKLHSMMDDGGKEIVLQVDGKTFARTSIKSINQLTKQTGKLDLVLA